MKNIFEKTRFHHWDFDENHEISDLGVEKIFLEKYFSSEKKSVSRKFLFFLQYHTISLHATQYESLTPNSLGGRSRTKKNVQNIS